MAQHIRPRATNLSPTLFSLLSSSSSAELILVSVHTKHVLKHRPKGIRIPNCIRFSNTNIWHVLHVQSTIPPFHSISNKNVYIDLYKFWTNGHRSKLFAVTSWAHHFCRIAMILKLPVSWPFVHHFVYIHQIQTKLEFKVKSLVRLVFDQFCLVTLLYNGLY